ncbi:MAG: HoxN/HupN/NixA family nickel/cobalt transporter [Propionibacterium sp.]
MGIVNHQQDVGRRGTRPAPSAFATQDHRRLLGMAVTIVALHLVGFGVLLGQVAPRRYALGGSTPVFTAGVGLLAYTFGLRHAFDADHIAAIDNTTRKLLTDRPHTGGAHKQPLSTGFWFSLGHSTVVLTLAILLSTGVKVLAGQVQDDASALHSLTNVIGSSVSGVFLWVIGLLNLAALVGIMRVFRRMRHGEYDEAELEESLEKRGFMNRILGGLTKSVTRPWQLYPIGLLFGLGFDTASEVSLLVLAGGAAAFDLPVQAILVLPVLFAAGMCLMDTVDGVLMTRAYGWAFLKPVRKVYYNLTITFVSVIVALGIGTVELMGVIAEQAHIDHGVIAAIAAVPLDSAGYGIVGLFLLSWITAMGIWRIGRVEERWSPTSGATTGQLFDQVGADSTHQIRRVR